MQPFALLLISLPLTGIALFFPADEGETKTKSLKEGSSVVKENISEPISDNSAFCKGNPEGSSAVQDSQWLEAVLVVGSVQIWAFFIASMLFLISQTSYSAELKLYIWLAIVAMSLRVSLSLPDLFSANMSNFSSPSRHGRNQLWMAVKALTLGIASIGLAVMSTVNYPVALVGALILVPTCLGVFPRQYIWNSANRPGKSILNSFIFALAAVMTVIGSPPGLAWLVWSLGGRLWTPSPANFWYFMESLVSWQSALFPYLLVIHLPCSVLCFYVFFSTHQPTVINK